MVGRRQLPFCQLVPMARRETILFKLQALGATERTSRQSGLGMRARALKHLARPHIMPPRRTNAYCNAQ
jgi:hypothetical protein